MQLYIHIYTDTYGVPATVKLRFTGHGMYAFKPLSGPSPVIPTAAEGSYFSTDPFASLIPDSAAARPHSIARSFHSGLNAVISAIFLLRFQFFAVQRVLCVVCGFGVDKLGHFVVSGESRCCALTVPGDAQCKIARYANV
jgi:hypothetical protein